VIIDYNKTGRKQPPQEIENVRPIMRAIGHERRGIKMLSLHRDNCTVVGTEIMLFNLATSPFFLETTNSARTGIQMSLVTLLELQRPSKFVSARTSRFSVEHASPA
jgi:hypothetical protein